MNHNITPEAVRAALSHISANLPRDEWARIGMAIKSEFAGDDGLALFDAWSASGENYNAKAVRSTWQSIKPGGGVTIATLLHEAKQNGFDWQAHAPALPLDAATLRQQAEQKARAQAAEKAQAEERQRTAASNAQERWRAALEVAPADKPSYTQRKGVAAFGLRFEPDGTALVPLCDGTGKLWNVQSISPTKPAPDAPDKFYTKGGRKAGLWHLLGTVAADSPALLLAEGYATAASLHMATGYPVAVAFDAGNLQAVARALRALHPHCLLVVCGDDDAATAQATGRNPGKEKAQAAAKAVQGACALPLGLQGAESDFNDLHQRMGLAVIKEQIAAALSAHHAHAPAQPPQDDARTAPSDADPFSVTADGVYFYGRDADGRLKPPMLLCSRLDVTAGVRDFEGGGFGYLLEFNDPLGHAKSWPMPARMLAGDGNEYRSALLSMGLRIEPGAAVRALLSRYIQSRTPQAWAHCTDRTGWHKSSGQAVFVLPRQTIGSADAERVIYQSDSPMENTFKAAGTLLQWQEQVARLCVGNSRLLFAVSCAFAAPLLRWVGMESGGFHFRGDSSCGKTTALRVAASVFGGASYMQRWRATDNALESIAAQHCDALLVLDELAQIDPKQAGEVAYMLGNGQSKARATRAALPKPRLSWHLLFLSAGEIGLAQHMAEGGKRARAGQELRMCDMQADAGAGLGIFEDLHGHESGAALSDAATRNAARFYGQAGLQWLQYIVANQHDIAAKCKASIDMVAAAWVPKGSSGQVQRVARRFALVACAGELASHAGITGWPADAALAGVKACFDGWLAVRGGTGNAEEYAMLAQARNFLELHGAGRFTWWHRAADDHAPNTLSRAGYRRMLTRDGTPIKNDTAHMAEYGDKVHTKDAEEIEAEYLILPEVFNNEICKGFDPVAVKKLLAAKGHLKTDSKGRLNRSERLPGMALASIVHILPSIFADTAD